jgi:GMP synthase-like glutamine amidotransferase
MARCLVLQHLEAEGPYQVAEALRVKGIEVDTRLLVAGDSVPSDLGAFDALVVMGGTMSAASDDGFPTRRSEITLLEMALSLRMPLIGICLGAQLLAVAAGAKVYPGDKGSEVGWMPVQLTNEAGSDGLFSGVDSPLTVLQWHGDTFDLPEGSVLLAKSERYPNQGFRLGDCAWGLQFHLEVDEDAVRAFMGGFDGDACTRGVSRELVEAETPGALSKLAPIRTLIFDRFAELVSEHASVRADGGIS